ncbi:MAG: uncharacterized protein QG635_415 [Bacteroidota bacterium]|nr:uncharacterized protein [Bacteroidota bacterium]
MRLSEYQRNSITASFRSMFPEHLLYLFGSRTDDSQKGGDIDLLILGDTRLTMKEIRIFKIDLYKKIGEQKIDIISYAKDDNETFKELILNEAVPI